MRLIDADKLPLDIEREDVDDAPTIDAVEVKPGRWEEHILDGIMGHRPTIIVCSECNCTAFAKFNYCPNCGARMRKGEE